MPMMLLQLQKSFNIQVLFQTFQTPTILPLLQKSYISFTLSLILLQEREKKKKKPLLVPATSKSRRMRIPPFTPRLATWYLPGIIYLVLLSSRRPLVIGLGEAEWRWQATTADEGLPAHNTMLTCQKLPTSFRNTSGRNMLTHRTAL